MSPEFLDVDDVVEIHRIQIEEFGGIDGLRDPGLLNSAVAQPTATFGGSYLHEDLFAMAAAYLFHMVKNHPFLDGNKRTGLAAALTFLDLNGYELEARSRLYDQTIALAAGGSSKDDAAGLLRDLARPRPGG